MKRNDIGILFTFLEQFRPEATGRERERRLRWVADRIKLKRSKTNPAGFMDV